MPNGTRRDKNSGTWGKLNHDIEVPQDKVSPKSWIEHSKCRDGTPTKWEVSIVNVVEATCIWPKIKCGACEHAVEEVPLEAGIHFKEGTQVLNIVGV